MTFNKRRKTYRGPDGLTCDQSEAVGADGIVKTGYSVSVALTAADSVPPGMTIVLDTDAARSRYVERMSQRAAPRPADAPPVAASGEGTAHSDYLARMTRRANKEA